MMSFKGTHIVSSGFMLILITVSCSGNDRIEKAVRISGDNRAEILEALSYFEGDMKKSEAVEWTVGNMPGNHTLGGHALKSYQGYYHLFSEIGKEAIPRIDSLVKDEGFSVGALTKYEDLRYIKSQYLLHNTNLAFKVRDSLPWCADIKKEDFLRYVVPYRIGDEELSCWRDSVLSAFSPVIDSLVDAGVDDPLVAAQAIMGRWNRREFRWTGQLPSGPTRRLRYATPCSVSAG